MKIAIGSDHGGFDLKQRLMENYSEVHDILDVGCFSKDAVDYPDIAKLVSKAVQSGDYARGILICRSGQGMGIAANRFSGIRAAVCYNVACAEGSRRHNDSNVLALGADYTGSDLSIRIVDAFLNTSFEGGRHAQRVAKIDSDVKVSASLLSNPPMDEQEMLRFMLSLEQVGIDSFHWDVMDGAYNSNNTWTYQGPERMATLRKATNLDFVAHLMVKDPIEKIKLFNEAGCNTMLLHHESTDNILDAIDTVRSYGRKVGVVIEPSTFISEIEGYLPKVDEVLVMSVQTGYAGQSFIDIAYKVRSLAEIRKNSGLKFDISVDGGINAETGKICRDAGADILIAASYIQAREYSGAINTLRGLK